MTALRGKYFAIVRDIAQKWLDWDHLGPLVRSYQAMIAAGIGEDTKKLDSTQAFELGLELKRLAQCRCRQSNYIRDLYGKWS